MRLLPPHNSLGTAAQAISQAVNLIVDTLTSSGVTHTVTETFPCTVVPVVGSNTAIQVVDTVTQAIPSPQPDNGSSSPTCHGQKDTVTQVMDQALPVANAVVNEGLPVANAVVNEGLPVANAVVNEGLPVANAVVNEVLPVANAVVNEGLTGCERCRE